MIDAGGGLGVRGVSMVRKASNALALDIGTLAALSFFSSVL